MTLSTRLLLEFTYDQDIVIVFPRPEPEGPACQTQGGRLRDGLASLMVDPEARYVVMDLTEIHCVNSGLLGFVVAVWKLMKRRGGTMVLCGVRPFAQNVLEVTHLSRLWPAFRSRCEAIGAIQAARCQVRVGVDQASAALLPASEPPAWMPLVGEANCHATVHEAGR
jgi:anti-anti-sigma regulatory factor